MTIAICHVSPEGIVLGADSTSSCTYYRPGGTSEHHYFNHEQKIFEVGEDARLGIVTWGLGSVGNTSHRTLVARLADDFKTKPVNSVNEAADLWASLFWSEYQPWLKSADCGFHDLAVRPPFDPHKAPPGPNARSEEEENLLNRLKVDLGVGFAIAGYFSEDREPKAYSLHFSPMATAAPVPTALGMRNTVFWGVPNIILRMLRGYDDSLISAIESTGKWKGSRDELVAALANHVLTPGHLPIRDAIDYVHTCVASTIKALKFSHLAQVCGGPIELAVITTDRRFRWVKHKPWDAAIEEGNSQ